VGLSKRADAPGQRAWTTEGTPSTSAHLKLKEYGEFPLKLRAETLPD
ncbi:hypothetical protein A2U01_0066821, partial [Trifolium medium]|nr:hypothetical protein [Trifolium medium]